VASCDGGEAELLLTMPGELGSLLVAEKNESHCGIETETIKHEEKNDVRI
jgi:hypothetical protein